MTTRRKEKNPREGGNSRPSASFTVGAIALVFLIVGYQSAVFIHKASVSRVVAHIDRPDTVWVEPVPSDGDSGDGGSSVVKVRERRSGRTPSAGKAARELSPRKVESFRFDPNTVSEEDLQRLGFSPRQALSIVHYREKGGRFRRPSDFADSYVVADSVYERLKPYIDIPLIDLNRADSAALVTLPGIGKWYAGKILSYREELGGYSYPEQLMDIWKFDREKFDGLADLVTVSPGTPYPLWTAPEEELARHPYIGSLSRAHAIVIFRRNNPRDSLTVPALARAGVLSGENASRLSRCLIAPPP